MAFRIRVPGPIHGWPAFANEIFVIVVGVLIALGFEALVEEFNWRGKAEDGEARLRVEMHNLFGHAAEQVIVAPCVLAQLDGIRAHLSAGGPRSEPMPLDRFPNNLAVLRLPTRPWSSAIWEALQQDGTATHFPLDRQRYLGNFYSGAETMRALVMQSGDAAGRMLVTGYPGELPPDMRTSLLLTAAEQYRRTQYMTRLAAQMMGSLRDLGYAPSDSEVGDLLKRTNVASNTIGFCRDRGLPTADWKQELANVPHLSRRPI